MPSYRRRHSSHLLPSAFVCFLSASIAIHRKSCGAGSHGSKRRTRWQTVHRGPGPVPGKRAVPWSSAPVFAGTDARTNSHKLASSRSLPLTAACLEPPAVAIAIDAIAFTLPGTANQIAHNPTRDSADGCAAPAIADNTADDCAGACTDCRPTLGLSAGCKGPNHSDRYDKLSHALIPFVIGPGYPDKCVCLWHFGSVPTMPRIVALPRRRYEEAHHLKKERG